MLLNQPYLYRLLFLAVLMGIVVAIDYWRHPTNPTKLREYSVLLLSGLVGASIGIINDQLTCTLSPTYFHEFKAIPYGPNFRWRVAAIGFEAGFFAGIFIYAIFLLVNQRRKVRLRHRQLLRMATYPMAWAVVVALLGSLMAGRFPFRRC